MLLVAFLVIEARRAQPMLDLTLFRKPAFAGASIAAFALSASMFAMFLYLTLYLQNVLGYSPLDAGPALPADARCWPSPGAARRAAEREGPRPLPVRRRAGARRHRAAADGAGSTRLGLDGAARRASCSRAPASG